MSEPTPEPTTPAPEPTPAPTPPTPPTEAPKPVSEPREKPAENKTNVGLVARLASKARGFKEGLKRAEKERDTWKSEVDALKTQLTDLQRLADTDANRKRADELASQLCDLRHKQAFHKSALAAGAEPDLIDDLYAVSGYKAEADEPEPEAMAEFVATLKAAKPKGYWQSESEAEEGEPAPPPKPAPKPSPSPGRSAPIKETAVPVVTEENLHDPLWVFNNTGKTKESVAGGRFKPAR